MFKINLKFFNELVKFAVAAVFILSFSSQKSSAQESVSQTGKGLKLSAGIEKSVQAENQIAMSGGQAIPQAYLRQMEIEWSKWIGQLDDRWYYTLRVNENGLGVRFHSQKAALIQFTCYADGQIGNVIIKQSSGVPAYDIVQIRALMETTPLPPFPAGSQRNSITLTQGWDSHPADPGEQGFIPGSYRDFPREKVAQWVLP